MSLFIDGLTVERFSSFKFLTVNISVHLSRNQHVDVVTQAVHQRLYFPRGLKRDLDVIEYSNKPLLICCRKFPGWLHHGLVVILMDKNTRGFKEWGTQPGPPCSLLNFESIYLRHGLKKVAQWYNWQCHWLTVPETRDPLTSQIQVHVGLWVILQNATSVQRLDAKVTSIIKDHHH